MRRFDVFARAVGQAIHRYLTHRICEQARFHIGPVLLRL